MESILMKSMVDDLIKEIEVQLKKNDWKTGADTYNVFTALGLIEVEYNKLRNMVVAIPKTKVNKETIIKLNKKAADVAACCAILIQNTRKLLYGKRI